ncbi:hypothetical protein PanWU01x14_027760 [Parasponia andersonii]|uniref:Uncharacterized protein n=1 Tax=Parasponia andersonii TaxID=3476 RepID=A0A2P5DV56_PARAD|nr:hypothetical protein PanWU01x14_027760 [Parasponia andersonii]
MLELILASTKQAPLSLQSIVDVSLNRPAMGNELIQKTEFVISEMSWGW